MADSEKSRPTEAPTTEVKTRHSPAPWRISIDGDFLNLSTSDRNHAHLGRIIVKEVWMTESVAAETHLNLELARRAPELYASLARVSAALKKYVRSDSWYPEDLAAVQEANALLDLKPPECLLQQRRNDNDHRRRR